MLKLRIQGTKNDIRWFIRILQADKRYSVENTSTFFDNFGTKKYKRVYTEIFRNKDKQLIMQENNIMCKVIATANQKGGVGQTTTAANLGIGLARLGKKVLMIDADSQGSLTASLGYMDLYSMSLTLATVMGHVMNDEEFDKKE